MNSSSLCSNGTLYVSGDADFLCKILFTSEKCQDQGIILTTSVVPKLNSIK